ncbi:hypothetical protein BJY01DRAFT_118846 [Aspergillus pseudoustus]|uniref:Zn(2)-C6 fungal-type domain-containing protein n=1 Tax=Aspergillus pseudoustus TaxID=1810923 RepID=A0ABR4IRY9_9EURO
MSSMAVAPAPPRAFQTTFQVTLRGGPIGSTYHARRAHKKSRNGCLVCKQRRVKCDERKPSCRRCENYGASCIYYPSPTDSSSGGADGGRGSSPESEPSRVLFTLSVGQMVGKVRQGMSGELAFAPRTIGSHDAVLNLAVNAFQFFLQRSTDTVATPLIRKVMRSEMLHVAFDNPYLMYTILGCGILHMNRMNPGDESRELAEAYFWQQAIGLYSRALEAGINEKSFSPLVSGCMLMGITSLAPLKCSIQDSWVFTGRDSDLNWLAVQGGLNCILSIAAKYIPNSIWDVAFSTANGYEQKLFRYDIEKGREGLHPKLADLCEIDDETTGDTSPYYFALKILSPLLELEPNAENAAHCATWMGRLEPEFVALCRRRDPRALVILAHWMGLMCTLSAWQMWVEGRVRLECIAVCMYLENLGDPTILPFLEYPANGCGYTLLKGL